MANCFFCNGQSDYVYTYKDKQLRSQHPIQLNSCLSCESLDTDLILAYIEMKLWTTSYLGRYTIHQFAKAMRK